MLKQKNPTAVKSIPEAGSVMAQAIMTGSTVKTPVARAKEWITQHPLIAFFLLTYAFSWTLWLVFPSSNVGAFGPAFSAFVLSSILTPEKLPISRPRHGVIFISGFVVALSVWALFRAGMKMDPSWFDGLVSALFIAVLLLGPTGSRRGVRDLLAPLAAWRVGWQWYVVALLFSPAILLAGVGVDLALGGHLPPPSPLSKASVVMGSAFILLFGSGFTEEPGWRGFALPRMQHRFSPLVTSVILGSLWAFWHAPLYFTGFYTSTSNTGPAWIFGIMSRFVWVIPLAIIFTWVYNHTHGSLLIAVLLHASFNSASAFIPLSAQAGVLARVVFMWVVALLVIVSDHMWRKTQPDVLIISPPTGFATNELV